MPEKPTAEEIWHATLTGDIQWRRERRFFKLVPATQRCKNCYAPASGLAAKIARWFGRGPFRNNPRFCDY